MRRFWTDCTIAGLCVTMMCCARPQPVFANWQQDGADWYYEQPGGRLADSWIWDETGYYYVQSEGRMVTGWQMVNGIWYFFNPVSDGTRGRLLTNGWFWIDGYCYFFHEDGHMLQSTTTPDGYTVNESGAWIENGQAVYRGEGGIRTKYVADGGGLRGSGSGSGGSGGSRSGTGGRRGSGGSGSGAGGGRGSGNGNGSGTGGGKGGSSSGSGAAGGNGSSAPDRPVPVPEVPESEWPISVPEDMESEQPLPGPTEPAEDDEPVFFSYQILYQDIDTGAALKEVHGKAEKDSIVTIDHPAVDGYEICEDQPEQIILSYDNYQEAVYYKADIIASGSNATIDWRVHFVDADTHQIKLAETRAGTIQEGGTLIINFMPRIIINDVIWTALADPPLTITADGFGNQIYYVEYEKTGDVPHPEDPFADEQEQLAGWLKSAKEAESLITGEKIADIPDSRFFVTDKAANDARIRSITGQIRDQNLNVFYLIGNDYIPSGTAITEWYGRRADYSIVNEDTIAIDEVTYTITRITIALAADSETDEHIWELTEQQEATCTHKGVQIYSCSHCQEKKKVYLPALGHADTDGDRMCDRCGEPIDGTIAYTHWKVGDIQAQELDGEVYFFECIDQNYTDESGNNKQMALFLCTSIIPANTGSEYKYEKQADGTYNYTYYPGPIVNFGFRNDYKYSKIRSWLNSLARDTCSLGNTSIGVAYSYIGATGEASYEQFAESELQAYYIGNQKMADKLFILSLDEAIKYKDYLWEVEETDAYSKGYWLRNPTGTSNNHDTGYVYIVDIENGNIRPQVVSPAGNGADEELNITGTTGVRPAYTMPQN